MEKPQEIILSALRRFPSFTPIRGITTPVLRLPPRPARVFRADRPFLFAVVRFEFDDRVHTPLRLFLVRVTES